MKCLNVYCNNEQSYLKKNKGSFCRSCIVSKDPIVLRCGLCSNTFEVYYITGRLNRWCSKRCSYRNNYLTKIKPKRKAV